MNKLLCLILMPYSPHRTFVYEMGIKKAVEDVNIELCARQSPPLEIKLETQRADEVFTSKSDKVEQIKGLISESDLVIVDISELNPNVFWELGYSNALDKDVVIIGELAGDLPFNIRLHDFCKYQLDFEGMSRLRRELTKRLGDTVQEVLKKKESLIQHKDFITAREQVKMTLGRIREDSLLTQLALNELSRIGTRFQKLGHGLFELRNVKPYEEVIEYYCEYVSQLNGADSKFDVVSNLNFWKEITRNGTTLRYIFANADAARQGASVQRVILVDANEFQDKTLKADPLYKYILKILFNKQRQKDLEGKFQTRLYFSEHFDAVRETYGNFGILTKGPETLLFEPQYESTRMKETTFIYINKHYESADAHLLKIKRYESLFREVWERGEVLDEKHLT